MPPADEFFYPPYTDFEAPAPLLLAADSQLLDLNDLLQHPKTDIDFQSPEAATGYPHFALASPPSCHPLLSCANESNASGMIPMEGIKSVFNVQEQVSVTMATGEVLPSDCPSQSSTWSTLCVSSGHPYSLVNNDHVLTQAASSCSAGPSLTSTSETAGPSFQYKYTSTMARKVEEGFLCPADGCARVHKRRDTLKGHFQRFHSVSKESVMCPEPGCSKPYGLLPDMKRHHAMVHGNGARYCPCLKRMFTRRNQLIKHCPNRENCSGAVDRRRRKTIV
ncbi:MAG: hypothetical protein BYD32DRAFT_148291 [Podila humilis]|nr:MAG: hypothetical protein BYD32DRAFT_148291 [Podila humilis]